jgi:hypothetical protein
MEDDSTEKKIEQLKQLIRETPPDLLQNTLYTCVSNTCTLLTSFLQMNGSPGWSARLVDSTGQPMLSSEEQLKIERAFSSAPWILPFLKTVKGNEEPIQSGGAAVGVPQLSVPGSQILEYISDVSQLTGEDVSLDAAFQKFLKKSDEMDEYWNTFAYSKPGISKLLNTDVTVVLPFTPPIPVPIPLRPVVSFLIAILDSIRLSSALLGNQSNLLTLVVLLEELLTGQWRQMILTSIGFFSPSGVALGVIFKYIVNAWMLVNPSLRETILKDIYKGTKSAFLGFLLWLGTTLPPNTVKIPLEASFQEIKSMVSGLDEKVKEIEEQASKTLAPLGKKLKFKNLQLDTLRKISLQDIQNLQTLAQWKVITCSSEFDDIIRPLTQNAIFRLIIELLGIPVLPDDKLEMCGAPPYKSISEVASEAFTPEIVDSDTPFFNPITQASEQLSKTIESTSKNIESKLTQATTLPPLNPKLPSLIGGSRRRKTKSKKRHSSKRLTPRRSSRS